MNIQLLVVFVGVVINVALFIMTIKKSIRSDAIDDEKINSRVQLLEATYNDKLDVLESNHIHTLSEQLKDIKSKIDGLGESVDKDRDTFQKFCFGYTADIRELQTQYKLFKEKVDRIESKVFNGYKPQ